MSTKTRYRIVIVLCCIALINAVYLTYHAYSLAMSSAPARCDVNDRWSCTNVLAAPESKILGVPFPAIAMVVYPILGLIAWFGLQGRMRHAWKWLAGLSAGGMVFNGYIIYVEATQIGSYCILCLMCTAIIVTIFGISVMSIPRSSTSSKSTQ